VPDIGIALGALSTYARPTALTAMTVSALDDLAPGRSRWRSARRCRCA
jgi:alkanesulfonate monooxygenase SsuD/methylene tetrahydromethanopterin reductase-like flavin-dependent oxidoreductase (luciferase family)